jgi:branched-chain amino acid transport system substrate-binding protein
MKTSICTRMLLMIALSFSTVVAWGEKGLTATEIVIGSCSALQGPASALGTQTTLGANAYFSMVNDRGGVNGRKLKLVSYDDGYEPEKTIACVNKLIQEDEVFAMGFFVGTPTGAKAAPMAEAHKIPIIGFFSGAELLRTPLRHYVVNVRASYYNEASTMVNNLVDVLGMKKIAVFYQQDAFGNAVLEGVKIALSAKGMTPVALGTFERNTLEVQAGMDKIKPSQPDAVIMVGPYAPIAEFVKRAHAEKWSSQMLTVSFVGTEAFEKAAGENGNGVVITQVVPSPSRTDLPLVKQYGEALKKYSPGAPPSFASLEGFVDAAVIVEGLKRAGKDLTRDKLIDAIEAMHGEDIGIGMKVNYSSTDHQGFDQLYPTVIRGGVAVPFKDWASLKK